MFTKKGAIVEGLCREMCYACGVVDSLYWAFFGKKALLTSAKDSHEHKPTSLHNVGRAADFGIHMLSKPQTDAIYRELIERLNPLGFDVVHEYIGTPNEHIHIEWQPKGNEKLFVQQI